MYALSRKRRATAGQIYSVCSMWGNCPQDVKNKVEGNTTADKILKFGSAAIYLGNAGITASVPTASTLAADAAVGQAVSLGAREGILAPDLPVGVTGPRDILPVDVVNPLGPARGATLRPGEEIPLRTFSVHEVSPDTVETFLTDSTASIPGETIGPKVQVGTADNSAVMEVPRRWTGRRTISRSQYDNPAFEVSVHTNIDAAETSATDQVFVTATSGGHHVGEDIPLHTLGAWREEPPMIDDTITFDTEIDETGMGQRTSTPKKPRIERPESGPGSRGPRRKGILAKLLNRNTEQVPVSEEAFLSHPATLVTFDNPAFDPSLSLIFERDLQEVAAAPHFAFRDLLRLGRPVLNEAPGGRVRVSRLGKRGTLRTRSGLVIGQDVHYFRDVSTIEDEGIPMQILGEHSGTGEVADGRALSGTHVNDDEDVIETSEHDAQNVEVTYGSLHDNPGTPQPDYIAPPKVQVVVIEDDQGVVVDYPGMTDLGPSEGPLVLLDPINNSGDYYLHPSLMRKRKKRISL